MRTEISSVAKTIFPVVCVTLLASLPALSQEVQVYPDVFREIKHDLSPPLRSLRQNPHEAGPPREMHSHKTGPTQITPSQPDPVLQTSAGPLVSTTAGLNFDGVGVGITPTYTDCCAPPDTNGAVGATQFVQWVNLDFAVFDKTTGALVTGPTAGNTLWSGFGGPCEVNNSGDPIAQYDKAAGRWVLTQPAFTSPFFVCLAVSTTSDATGTYNRYAFSVPNFPDYPKLGVWPDGYYMSFNMFRNGVRFLGGAACALDRSAMLAGAAATMQCFQLSSSFASLLPSDLDGTTAPATGSPNFLLNFGSNSLNLWKFHVDFATPANSTLTGPTNIPVAAFSPACGGGACIPQLGTSQLLDSLGDRLMYRLAYRNFGDHESLVVNHSVTAGSSVGARWYELRSPNATPIVFQQGTFAPDANFRWMGSIAMDHVGNIAVGYSVSGSGINPAIASTGRVPTDPPGTLEAENTILGGTGSQLTNLNRWGDYSSLSVDPVDDCTFWYTTEYLKTDGTFNWSTRIASFKFPSCSTTPTPDFSISATPASQTVVQGNSTSYTASTTALNGFTGTVTFSASGLPAGANASFSPASVAGSGTSTMTVTTSATTPVGSYTLTITGTSGSLVHSTTVTLVVNAAASGDFSISATPASQTVVQGNSTSYTASVTALSGFTGTVTFSSSGLPAGANASFSPPSVAGSGTSTMTVTTSATTPAGSYTLTITGTSGSLVHSTTVTLVVNAAASGDFSISATPSPQTVVQGSSTSYTVSVTALNGFTGTVSFSVSGVPPQSSGSFNPTSVAGSGSSSLTVSLGRNTPTKTYTLTITGTGGSLVHSTTATLTVL